MAYCPACQREVPEGLKFCTSCGNKMVPILIKNPCPSCGKENPAGVKFCVHCGSSMGTAQVPPTEENPLSGKQETLPVVTPDPSPQKPIPPAGLFTSLSEETPSSTSPAPSSKGKRIALIAGVLVIALIGLVVGQSLFSADRLKEEGLSASSGLSMDASETGDLNPAPIPLSGSNPFRIEHSDALTLWADEHALDQDRDFQVATLQEDELFEFATKVNSDEWLVLDAYHVDAGLAPDELLPGHYTIEMDLKAMGIPENLYDQVSILRYSDGQPYEEMNTWLEGHVLMCQARQNSILSAVLLGLALGLPVVYHIEYSKREMAGPAWLVGTATYENVNWLNYKGLDGYTIYWPDILIPANPQEVDQVRKALEAYEPFENLVQKQKQLSSGSGVDFAGDYSGQVRDFIDQRSDFLYQSALDIHEEQGKAYAEASKKMNDTTWREDNLYPVEVMESLKAMRYADEYLFTHRQLRKPKNRTEVFLLPDWPHGSTEYGFAVTPWVGPRFYQLLGPIYMHINVSPAVFPQVSGQATVDKDKVGNFRMTILHELFHVAQGEYLRIGSSLHTSFFESTAVMLEYEALDYYQKKGWLSQQVALQDRDFLELLRLNNGLPYSWQGQVDDGVDLDYYVDFHSYTFSRFYHFMRDRYYASQPDQFLNDILTRYGWDRNWSEAMIHQTSNNEEMFKMDFRIFYSQLGANIAERVVANSASFNQHEYRNMSFQLNQDQPFLLVDDQFRILSSGIKVFHTNYDTNLYSPKDVTFVLMKNEPSLFENHGVYLRTSHPSSQQRGYDFESVIGKYHVIAHIEPRHVAIQEIHTSRGAVVESMQYSAFLLLPPGSPHLKMEENRLVVNLLPYSQAAVEGIVNKYLVTIQDPYGHTVVLETREPQLELELDGSGDFIDWETPEIKNLIGDSARKYLENNPSLRAQLESEFDQETVETALNSVGDLNMDIGAMGRAAEVLNQAAGHQGAERKFTVTYMEMIEDGDTLIYGPVSDVGELTAEAPSSAGVSILGTWKGRVQITNQEVMVGILPGKDGYDYLMTNSLYPEVQLWGNDNGDGTVTFGKEQGFEVLLIKNSENELYQMAPPITLRRQ